jgi:nitrogen regulatory protein PII-like uncharacterized protein
MAKTKEITFMCESTQSYSTYENRIKVVADVSDNELATLINSIPKEDLFRHLDESVFEEWAEGKGYVKEVPQQ